MRSRAPAFIINTKVKRDIVNETNTSMEAHQQESKLKMMQEILNRNLIPCNVIHEGASSVVSTAVPEFTYMKKVYNSDSEFHLKIHPKAVMPDNDNKQVKLFAQNELQSEVDFVKFMAMFDNENEISEIDSELLLGIDIEKLGGLKEKLNNIISYLKGLDLDATSEKNKKKVIDYLHAKLADIDGNEENYQNVMCNVDKITRIKYGNKITKIFFK